MLKTYARGCVHLCFRASTGEANNPNCQSVASLLAVFFKNILLFPYRILLWGGVSVCAGRYGELRSNLAAPPRFAAYPARGIPTELPEPPEPEEPDPPGSCRALRRPLRAYGRQKVHSIPSTGSGNSGCPLKSRSSATGGPTTHPAPT